VKEVLLKQVVAMLSTKLDMTTELTPELSLVDDLALDSLQLFEVIALAEETFNVNIPHTSIFLIDSVEEVAELIYSLKTQDCNLNPAVNA
jgi:acyl carrier protein